MLTLAQLTTPKTIAQVRQQLIDRLQGRGLVAKAGTGTGSIAVSGSPTLACQVVVKIYDSGEPGAGHFQFSVNGGASFGLVNTIPSPGASFPIPSTGASVTFAAGLSGAGTSFVVGDTFSFGLFAPNFPTTSWQDGSTPRTLLEVDAEEIADLTSLVATIAASGFASTARGSWLDLVGQDVYQLTRNPAVVTQGTITLTDAGGAGPFNIAAGQIWVAQTASVATSTPLRFLNVAGGTLPKNGTLVLTVAAEAPGSAYNVAAGSITTMLTTLPGVTVSNPAGSSGWITTSGTDQESDAAYSSRCRNRWPTIGAGATAEAYDYWARTANPEITRTKVVASGNGLVWLFTASAAGSPSANALSDVTLYIRPRQPLGIDVQVGGSESVPITIGSTVYCDAAQVVQAQADAAAAMAAFISSVPIGGTIYVSTVLKVLNSVPGVRNTTSGLTINGSSVDLALTMSQVATGPTLALTWVPV